MSTGGNEAGAGPFLVGHFRPSHPSLPNPHQLPESHVQGWETRLLYISVAGEGLAVDYTFSRQPFSGDNPHGVCAHPYQQLRHPHQGPAWAPQTASGISIQEFLKSVRKSPPYRVVEGSSEAGDRGENSRVCLWLLTVHSVPSQGLGSGSTEMASATIHALVDKTN